MSFGSPGGNLYDPRDSFPDHDAPRDSYQRQHQGPDTWAEDEERAERESARGKRPGVITRLRRAVFGGR